MNEMVAESVVGFVSTFGKAVTPVGADGSVVRFAGIVIRRVVEYGQGHFLLRAATRKS